ncbi:hypothetical protein QE152_g34419 [Popillia japonica]|uniref:Uncharacterized protein n=1 Tax=Popillia japonica TaxID=7064 RepID=A0AAW1IU06_POPJA
MSDSDDDDEESNEGDAVEEREQDSDTEQDIYEEIDRRVDFEYSNTVFMGNLIEMLEWAVKINVRVGRKNIIKEVPGVKGIAKEMKNPLNI